MLLSYLRTGFLYLLLILTVRLMGKRQVGQMEPSEFVVTMLVANLAAIPMQDGGIPLFSGLVPILTVLGLELVLSWVTMRSIFFRKLFCGKPVILIDNGRILRENLRRTRVTMDELTGHLREKDVLDIRTVQYAILETNGNLSVFPYPRHCPATAEDAGVRVESQYLPVTIVEDGVVLKGNLKKAGKSLHWLEKTLGKNKAAARDVLLLTVDAKDDVVCIRKEAGQ